MNYSVVPRWVFLLVGFNFALMLVTLVHYPGAEIIYIVFSVLLNALLFAGLIPGSLFFDTFIGILFWLGFWLKFSFRMIFAEGVFHEAVGYFDYTAASYDKALLVTSCGISGLLVARLIRSRYWFRSLSVIEPVPLPGLPAIYEHHRRLIWIGFLLLVLVVTVSNAYLGVYQRGSVPRTSLPYGLGGVYTWLLLFGFASMSAVMLNCELRLRAVVPFGLICIVLAETFLSNVSIFSRGMILNAGALLLGVFINGRVVGARFSGRAVASALIVAVVLFALSIGFVSQVRRQFAADNPELWLSLDLLRPDDRKLGPNNQRHPNLLLDRWVGMEGAMAVSSYPELGWELWRKAWREKYTDNGTSFYDREISRSTYSLLDLSRRHFVSIPGILAFFYYPSSYWFLFVGMFGLGILGALIEASVFRWGGGNLVLCSLISFVVAYRYMHFGYVPGRSYLLAGALVLNVLLIYGVGKVLTPRPERRERTTEAS